MNVIGWNANVSYENIKSGSKHVYCTFKFDVVLYFFCVKFCNRRKKLIYTSNLSAIKELFPVLNNLKFSLRLRNLYKYEHSNIQ